MVKYKSRPLYLDRSNSRILTPLQAKQIDNEKRSSLAYFASKHEYLVDRELSKLPENCTIHLQPKVEVIEPKVITCYPKGKTWKADFMVQRNNLPVMIVEAKGVLTKDFMLTLALLELNNPQLFSKLWLVFPAGVPNNLIIKRLMNTPMKHHILSLKEFKKQIAIMTMQ